MKTAYELGCEAGLDPHQHLGLNPFIKGQQPREYEQWRRGYESTVAQYTAQVKPKFDGLPQEILPTTKN